MNILILIKLIAAHVIGDFFLQTDKICVGKYTKGARRLFYLAIHSGINALFAYVLVGLWNCWQIPVIVFFTHYAIDYIKSAIGSGSLWKMNNENEYLDDICIILDNCGIVKTHCFVTLHP